MNEWIYCLTSFPIPLSFWLLFSLEIFFSWSFSKFLSLGTQFFTLWFALSLFFLQYLALLRHTSRSHVITIFSSSTTSLPPPSSCALSLSRLLTILENLSRLHLQFFFALDLQFPSLSLVCSLVHSSSLSKSTSFL